MRIKTLILSIAMMFAWMHSYGSDVLNVQIKRVHIYKDPAPAGGVFITFSGPPRANNPCLGNSQEYFIDLNDQPRGSLMYAQAVAAFKDDIYVNIYMALACVVPLEVLKQYRIFRYLNKNVGVLDEFEKAMYSTALSVQAKGDLVRGRYDDQSILLFNSVSKQPLELSFIGCNDGLPRITHVIPVK